MPVFTEQPPVYNMILECICRRTVFCRVLCVIPALRNGRGAAFLGTAVCSCGGFVPLAVPLETVSQNGAAGSERAGTAGAADRFFGLTKNGAILFSQQRDLQMEHGEP